MTIREQTQEIQARTLSKYASLSQNSLGRERPVEDCPLRTPYARDRDRILHCKSFRRLMHKMCIRDRSEACPADDRRRGLPGPAPAGGSIS